MTKNDKVIFICGAPHSGSTLLGLILGSHSTCFYGGEINKIQFLNIEEEHEDKYCKMCGSSCPIWNNFDVSDKKGIYQQLSDLSHKPNIIDSTKNVDWLKLNYKNLNSTQSSYLIYILRDGRAVFNSQQRKYKNINPNELIEKWIIHVRSTNSFYDTFEGKKIKIHYEELSLKPEETVKKLCNFLEISYEESMIQYYLHKHHPLGGNTGTQYLIIKAQDDVKENTPIKLSERNKYYYSDHPLEIKLDLRWKKELNKDLKKLFEIKAGSLNESFQWDD
ncbi:MAG: sulfotransferase [Candidatus Lokiarchaeota archaeon]|nr:sulfotransferase [Candidatus Lokiarchaeota archaeon]